MPKLRLHQYINYRFPWENTKIDRKISFDIETTGLNAFREASIFSYAITDQEMNSEVYRKEDFSESKFKKDLQKLFDDTSIRKTSHNYHFEYRFVNEFGINIPKETKWDCTYIAAKILKNNEIGYGIDDLYKRYFPNDKERGKYDSLVGKYKTIGYDKVEKNIFDRYQKDDTERGFLLDSLFIPLVESNVFDLLNYNFELELIRVTYQIEKLGLFVHEKNTIDLLKNLENKIKTVIKESGEYLGEYINLNSDKQVRALLFDRMGYRKINDTESGLPSTDKDTLITLKDKYPNEKIFDYIIQWRSYTNAKTIIENYLELHKKYGKINPTINTIRAITDRESSEDPNGQNIRKPEALKNLFPVNSRQCFKPPEDYRLYCIDYKGIEIRLIVELTDERVMKELILNGKDPHDYAAKLFFNDLITDKKKAIKFLYDYGFETNKSLDENKLYDKAYGILRNAAKNGQFALCYGAGINRISKTVNIPINLLRDGLKVYKKECPKIYNFTKNSIIELSDNGYVVTPFGRKLFPEFKRIYSIADHKIQCTGAALLKRSQVKLHKYFIEKWNNKLKLSIPIHDELFVLAHKSILQYEKQYLNDIAIIMTTYPEIKNVPLEIEIKCTDKTWDLVEKV